MSGTTSEPQARELVQTALGIAARAATRQPLTESGNAVFRVDLVDGSPLVLRMSPRPGVFAHTRANLAALRALGLPVPQFRARGATAAGGSYVILDWLAGRDLVYELPGLTPAQRHDVAATITDFQQRVGSLPAGGGYGWAPIGARAGTASWSGIFGAPAELAPPAGDASPGERLRSRLRAVRATLEPYFATVTPTCFLDDHTVKNVLIEQGGVCGIIDVDFVCYGDPLLAVGTTLAQVLADGGEAGRRYGDELLGCWNPSGDAARAVWFYCALWILGFLAAAEAAGASARALQLVPIAGQALERAGG